MEQAEKHPGYPSIFCNYFMIVQGHPQNLPSVATLQSHSVNINSCTALFLIPCLLSVFKYHGWAMTDYSVTSGTGLSLMPERRCRTDAVDVR
jgi:hypothetical protein